jgi:hypothetical protein
VVFQDTESGDLVEFDTSGPEAESYRQIAETQGEQREACFRRLKLDSVHVQTDKPYVDALIKFFRRRERRMQRL